MSVLLLLGTTVLHYYQNSILQSQSCQRTDRGKMSLEMCPRVDSETVTKVVTCLSLPLVVMRPPASLKRHEACKGPLAVYNKTS